MTEVFSTPTYCINHPTVETNLRCSRCERPICTKCAVLTPTGYRCPDCVRSQQKTFETAQTIDYPVAFIIAGALSYIGSLIASRLGFFTIFIAPIAGVAIAEAVRWAIRRRRSKRLFQLATGGAALGALVPIAGTLLTLLLVLSASSGRNLGGAGIGFLFPLLWQGVYAFLVCSTVYYRLSGIQMRR